MDIITIVITVFLPLVGFIYIAYAKVRRRFIPLWGGLSLIILPAFTQNAYILLPLLLFVVLGSYFFTL